ncbi:hypothetical protein [Cryobacterium sp. TMT2-42-4]|nr:hypothetical protein [Cryobacterium sp. TMT2-42-4]
MLKGAAAASFAPPTSTTVADDLPSVTEEMIACLANAESLEQAATQARSA